MFFFARCFKENTSLKALGTERILGRSYITIKISHQNFANFATVIVVSKQIFQIKGRQISNLKKEEK